MTDERFNELNGKFRLGMTVEEVNVTQDELIDYQAMYHQKYGKDCEAPIKSKKEQKSKLSAFVAASASTAIDTSNYISKNNLNIPPPFPLLHLNGSDFDTDADMKKIRFYNENEKKIQRLIEMGVLGDSEGINAPVRQTNVGKSDYSNGEHLIQPWSLWIDWNHLTSWDHDILKRLYRTKKEANMTADEARIMDYEKIIHDCKERIRQLKIKKQ